MNFLKSGFNKNTRYYITYVIGQFCCNLRLRNMSIYYNLLSQKQWTFEKTIRSEVPLVDKGFPSVLILGKEIPQPSPKCPFFIQGLGTE